MKLETVKKRVKKYYPEAKSFKELGLYYIGIPDTMDDTIINLFDEYFIQSTETEEEAWNKALLCCKTNQNFNRTHPDRIDELDERKHTLLKTRANKIHTTRAQNKLKSKIFIND